MKIKKPAKSLPVNLPRPRIKISHGQTVKQSANYQSADASYSVELIVDDSPSTIKAGIKRAEEIVEEAMAHKVTQQRKFLLQLNS